MIMWNQNIVKKQNCVIWIESVCIKADDIYKDVGEDVETSFDTSNYKLDRPQAKGKNKKVILIMKDKLDGKNNEKICCTKCRNL